MEEILASIRRILNDDEVPAPGPETPAAEDVLILDETMMVAAPEPGPPPGPHPPGPPPPGPHDVFDEPAPHVEAHASVAAEPAKDDDDDGFNPPPLASPHVEPPHAEIEFTPPAMEADPMAPADPAPDLIGPEAAAAAASSVGTLVRTLSASRATQVYSGGPTLEDMVRSELRPLLKNWLDQHLPPMVERLVRAEIERVVGRFVP
jgi:cell pole-organizing protein PopZ